MLTDPVMQFYNTALNVRAYREELLASNIANADTPNYQAKDIDFKTALKGAMHNISGGLPLLRNSVRQLSGKSNQIYPGVFTMPAQQSRLDGNAVNMNQARAAFTDNGIKYEATLTFMTQEIKTMQQAITG
ncbi:MAG TPA: flagellar basal body rod protein FlgB [Burkholderiales bacterium]|nr:flagellar basal body rod protein FlgB [Burkholderiales bacterium]